MTDPIKWDEESEPVKCLLKVSRLFPNGHNGSDHATTDDLRRACEAAGLKVCGCEGIDDGEEPIDWEAAYRDANKDRQELRAEVDRLQRCMGEALEAANVENARKALVEPWWDEDETNEPVSKPIQCEFPGCTATHPTLLEGDAEGEGWTCYGKHDECYEFHRDGWHCTRPLGHSGDHAAYVGMHIARARWPQSEPATEPELPPVQAGEGGGSTARWSTCR